MQVSRESPDQPEVIALIADLDAYQDTLYPAEARYALDLASLKRANVVFVVARADDGTALGCGAVVLSGSLGELKRMYVRPQDRGQGVAQRILMVLETCAASLGCRQVMLETGPYQPEALCFYRKQGYERRGPFGPYPDHPLNVFMAKELGAARPLHTGHGRSGPSPLSGTRPSTPMTAEDISLQPASPADAEALASLRVEAMRESLENVGRFDPVRARERFLSSFRAAHTRHILRGARKVGVVVTRAESGAVVLDHLYLHPSEHGQGIGSAVVRMIQVEAAAASLPLHVGALKDSRSNDFYIRHGFKPLAQGEWDNYYVWHAADDGR